jgi:hypothetical protein
MGGFDAVIHRGTSLSFDWWLYYTIPKGFSQGGGREFFPLLLQKRGSHGILDTERIRQKEEAV